MLFVMPFRVEFPRGSFTIASIGLRSLPGVSTLLGPFKLMRFMNHTRSRNSTGLDHLGTRIGEMQLLAQRRRKRLMKAEKCGREMR